MSDSWRGSRPGPLPRVHVLTDTRPDRDPVGIVDAVLAAGPVGIQVRVKGATDREHLAVAVAIVDRCRRAGGWCIVNDRLDIALASGADGVHLGADDLPVREARRLAARPFVVGGTARDPETARRLVEEGADYLGVGPVHRTTTKSGLPAPLGPQRFGAVARAVDVPVLAIGGMTRSRLPEVLRVGGHGAAVVGAVADAVDPTAATRELVAMAAAVDADGVIDRGRQP